MKKNINNFKYKKIKSGTLGVVVPWHLCLTCGESHCQGFWDFHPEHINSGIRTN